MQEQTPDPNAPVTAVPFCCRRRDWPDMAIAEHGAKIRDLISMVLMLRCWWQPDIESLANLKKCKLGKKSRTEAGHRQDRRVWGRFG